MHFSIVSPRVWAILLFAAAAACAPDSGEEGPSLHVQLVGAIKQHDLQPVVAAPPAPPAQIALGRMLFFDKILSGNRDVACSTCHLPGRATTDGLPLSVGTMGHGLGPERRPAADRDWAPRNAPALFHLADPGFTRLFWDGRVEQSAFGVGSLLVPGGIELPRGIDSLAAAQALFPPTSPVEMKGLPGDDAVDGTTNDVAAGAAESPATAWDALMARLLVYPEYRDGFAAAFPNVAESQLTFGHAARAIAAFERHAFTPLDSPWDRYVRGDRDTLSNSAKRGALLFTGEAGCVRCHSGRLLSDMKFHSLAVPQLGPGREPEAPRDIGRAAVTGDPSERYRFRTPPLRNAALTGPWFHDGSAPTLEAAIRHHLDPLGHFVTYEPSALPQALWHRMLDDPVGWKEILDSVDPLLAQSPPLSKGEITDLVSFLYALTDPAVFELHEAAPPSVPSGLPVDVGVPLHQLDFLPPEGG